MAPYQSLPDLRAALSSDEPDTRVDAYRAVFEADLEPRAVMGNDPPEDELVAAGVIEDGDSDDGEPTAQGQRARIIELLEQLTGDSGGE